MGRIPVELVATIIEQFSFEGQWVLDLTNAIGKSHTVVVVHLNV